jgi:heme a synthase
MYRESASALTTTEAEPTLKGFERLAWACLGYNLLVVLWGAVVRASGSGAGCGSHWPRCNGQTLPALKTVATQIEFSHRVTSFLAMVSVFALLGYAQWLLVRARRGFKPLASLKQVRRFATLASVFMLGEALLGAALVLFEHVAHNASLKRALSMSLHLVNTFMLLGAIVAMALAARYPREQLFAVRDKRARLLLPLSMVPVGVTGAIAALGDTLFPAKSLAEGMAQDLAPSAHVLLRLRTLHPFVALGSAALLWLLSGRLAATREGDARTARSAAAVRAIVLAQVCLGMVNMLSLAPMGLQLAHLLLADVLLVAVVWLSCATTRAPLVDR